MKRLRVVMPALLGLLTLSCSAERGSLRLPEAGRPSAPVVAPEAEASEASPVSPPPLDLQKFAPLLSEPSLAAARQAVEADAPARAVEEVERAMATQAPSAHLVPAYQMLLASLREQAGDLPGAAASYALAAKPAYPLAGYAHLGAGRVLVRAGLPDRAIEHLARVGPDELIHWDARLLMAEAKALTGDFDQAIAVWRTYVGRSEERLDAAVALRLAQALVETATRGAGSDQAALVDEVLGLVRKVSVTAAGDAGIVRRAEELEARALSLLPAEDRVHREPYSPQEQLVALEAMVDGGRFEEADRQAVALLSALPAADRYGPVACEATVLRSKALARLREWGRAADHLSDALRQCKGTDVRARGLYLAGKYSDYDKRYARAIAFYEQLERESPTHRLADDARLRRAESHMRLGSEARFTELLSTMADDYPDGDMVLDGVFTLAHRRIERADWTAAAQVLERGAALARERDEARGHEYAGRERYFLARARIALGETDAGLDELEALVRTSPLSYYMLHAYARLFEVDADRARRAREDAMEQAKVDPFAFQYQEDFERPGFRRALELLRLGHIDEARRELSALGLPSADTAPALLWGIGLLYARAGAYVLSHGVARGLLTDWVTRWPAGDWVQAWQLAFPRPYRDIVEREAEKNDIPEYLVYAVMREESAFEPTAISPANAYGLMQLIEPTARHYAKGVGLPADPKSLTKPRINITLGCRVLGDLTRRFSENPLLAIPGYNAGPGRPRRWAKELSASDFDLWVELIPFRETRRYTKRVLASRAAYAFLYQEADVDEALRLPLALN